GLGVTFLIIVYFLAPQILDGKNPVILSLVVSLAILAFTIYFTYGVNKKSHAAFAGVVISILFTFFLAFVAVDIGHLSGQTDDAATFLNVKTEGSLDFSALLLGAMIIGILGVLDDIAITQASAVQELSSAAKHFSRKEIFIRALHVGKEHVSALVNTIALAYTGAALPLMLLFMHSESSVDMIINRDLFATEILRIMVGSIGVVLTVPITTGLAVIFLVTQNKKQSK
ncbi:MAG: YibE/F family protein, partial [Candidatus Spechtbacterales bacterium]|nr:YibE/F family protein [Candidatus Spechtbacterales bacterium]